MSSILIRLSLYNSAPAGSAEPRSFVLTSNLDVRVDAAGNPVANAQNVTAIVISAENVTVDLNGFAILGPTVCIRTPIGTPVSICSPTGIGIGISCTAGAATLRNGTIRGMGNDGIACRYAASRSVQRHHTCP